MKPHQTVLRIGWISLALLGSILTTQAFYNPQTGRWLNRDPIEERGFRAARAAERSGYRDNLNRPQGGGIASDVGVAATNGKRTQAVIPFGFCRNEPADRTDALGLQDRTDAVRAGYCQDPCAEYATAQLEDNEGWMLDGAPICCGGKLYHCSWGHERLKNWRAQELVKECTEEHERTHDNHVQACAPCNWSATKADFRSDVNPNTAECEAYRAGVSCLSMALPRCGGDSVCEAEVYETLRAKEAAKDYFCNRALGRKQEWRR